jgi:hypothetical protein
MAAIGRRARIDHFRISRTQCAPEVTHMLARKSFPGRAAVSSPGTGGMRLASRIDLRLASIAASALTCMSGCMTTRGGQHGEVRAGPRGPCVASRWGEFSCDGSVVATVLCEGAWGSSCRSLGVRYARGDSIVWLERNERHVGEGPKMRFGGAFHVVLSRAEVWFTKHGIIPGTSWYRYDLASGVLSKWTGGDVWNAVHQKIDSGEATWLEQPRRTSRSRPVP